jgi:N-acetylglucosaminyl-diphospho-decaprenol L-rhamnosyltransferase
VTAPTISVIVLNYNGRRWLAGCLGAIAAQRGAPPFEVLVADNGSSDGSLELIAERFPDVQVVANGANLGFAAGNNVGAARARGEWLVFLNNDTLVAADWLARLHAPCRDDPSISVTTSRVVFLDTPAILDSAGDGYLRAGGAYKHGHRAAVSGFGQSREVFGACGAAFMIKRALFEDIGRFDERFFMVYEDVDLSYRLRLAGHRIWYASDAVVHHAGSGTLGLLSDAAVFYGQRNLEWTWIKNTPWPLLARTLASHVVYSTAGLAHYLRAGRLAPAVRGKLAAVAGLGEMLRARRNQRHSRRIDWREVDRWMDRGWLSLKRREKRNVSASPRPRSPGN